MKQELIEAAEYCFTFDKMWYEFNNGLTDSTFEFIDDHFAEDAHTKKDASSWFLLLCAEASDE